MDLSIHTDILIQIKRVYILGGHIDSMQEKNNSGWRIDYFLASEKLKDRLVSADIHTQILGSDHCPVELVLK